MNLPNSLRKAVNFYPTCRQGDLVSFSNLQRPVADMQKRTAVSPRNSHRCPRSCWKGVEKRRAVRDVEKGRPSEPVLSFSWLRRPAAGRAGYHCRQRARFYATTISRGSRMASSYAPKRQTSAFFKCDDDTASPPRAVKRGSAMKTERA